MALLQWIWVALSALGAISVRDSMDGFSGEQASARGALQIGSSAGRKHVLPSSGDGVLGTSEEGEEAGDLQADEEDKEDKEETNDAPDSAEDAEEDDKDEDGEQDAGSEAQSALREAGRKHGEAKYVYKTATEGFGDLDKVVESIDAAADDASAKAKTVDKDYAAYQGRMADTGRILDTLSLSGEQFKKEVVDYFARAEEDKFSPLAKRVQEKMAAHNATSPNVRDEGADDDKGEGDAVEEPDDASGAAPTKGAHGDQNEGDAVEESEEATDKAPTKGADKKSAGEDVEESEDASGKAPTKGEDAGN